MKKSFSKTLLIQESLLIWVMTIGFLILAFVCIIKGYSGSLPWLAAMASFPWAAYGVSQVYYYKKSLAENTKDGIIFETALSNINNINNNNNNNDYSNINNINNNNTYYQQEYEINNNNNNNNNDIDIFGPI